MGDKRKGETKGSWKMEEGRENTGRRGEGGYKRGQRVRSYWKMRTGGIEKEEKEEM